MHNIHPLFASRCVPLWHALLHRPLCSLFLQFNPLLPPPPARPMCFLPADVEFNARADTRNILRVLTGQFPLATAARANFPCFYQPGV